MEVTLEKANLDDAYELSSIHTTSWKAAYVDIVPENCLNNISVVKKAEKMGSELVQGYPFFYFIKLDNNKIGMVILGNYRDDDKLNYAEIVALYILPEHFRKGIGTISMPLILKEIKNKGFSAVLLWVLEKNVSAIMFYQKCGFVFDNHKRNIEIGTNLTELRCIKYVLP